MAAAYHVRSGYIRLELTGVNLWLNYDIASVPMSHHLDDHVWP